jgi:predicted MFS family arabinose efflux permease
VLGLAAVLFGIYAGAFFFYLVFHALTHSVNSARYVATNEFVVGLAGIVGPLLGGLLADRLGFATAALAGAAVLALVTAFQAVVHHRHPPVL